MRSTITPALDYDDLITLLSLLTYEASDLRRNFQPEAAAELEALRVKLIGAAWIAGYEPKIGARSRIPGTL